jgi:N-succinyldiaminopimelate aminotransferase
MSVRRLSGIQSIGVDRMGSLADQAADPEILRLENLDTDVPPPSGVIQITQSSVELDRSNSYLPFMGSDELRQAATNLVNRLAGTEYVWQRSTIVCAGGLTGILNTLLAILEEGDEVVLPDPIYIGLVNRVLLSGGKPVFVPYHNVDGIWSLDKTALERAITSRTRIFLMMSPSMPAGAVFTREDWELICKLCIQSGCWMIYDSAMERILFDGTEHIHPASFSDMAGRTITVGSVSKEYRMIGWRIGWIVAPPEIVNDIGLVNISNVVCPVGIAQEAAASALRMSDSEIVNATRQWEERRNVLLQELDGLPFIRPQGGWSLLMDVSGFGMNGEEASRRFFVKGKIAATPMTGWGSKRSDQFIRLVYSNEPVERLRGIRARIENALL